MAILKIIFIDRVQKFEKILQNFFLKYENKQQINVVLQKNTPTTTLGVKIFFIFIKN